jgi:hypothetical protein
MLPPSNAGADAASCVGDCTAMSVLAVARHTVVAARQGAVVNRLFVAGAHQSAAADRQGAVINDKGVVADC